MILVFVAELACGAAPVNASSGGSAGLIYTNVVFPEVPWSIHVVRLARTNPLYEIQTAHAGGRALGMQTLSRQVAALNRRLSTVVAAINGDFYDRGSTYAGSPRGLQVAQGELLSAPSDGVSVWIDAQGRPHLGRVASLFHVNWTNGTATPFGLNRERRPDELELYTPAVGSSTRTFGGCELVLEPEGNGPWLPLRLSESYAARVKAIRQTGNTRIEAGTMVLSAGPALAKILAGVVVGTVLHLSTGSSPALHEIQAAISGGPILLKDGRVQKRGPNHFMGYEWSSMEQRHPRAAVGWNQQYFFLVVVDGRQSDLSVGMTLDEFSKFLIQLGCEQALNFDGGGSATLWYDGQVRNNPCERVERDISNCLVILNKDAKAP